jgi:hypothetical protein
VLHVRDRRVQRSFPKRDQFAPELLHFSDCVLDEKDPEPSGREGLADVRVIAAVHRSAASGRPVHLPPFEKRERPDLDQETRVPAVSEPRPIRAPSPRG